MKSLGERIINARQKAGLTQDALAKKAGSHQGCNQ